MFPLRHLYDLKDIIRIWVCQLECGRPLSLPGEVWEGVSGGVSLGLDHNEEVHVRAFGAIVKHLTPWHADPKWFKEEDSTFYKVPFSGLEIAEIPTAGQYFFGENVIFHCAWPTFRRYRCQGFVQFLAARKTDLYPASNNIRMLTPESWRWWK